VSERLGARLPVTAVFQCPTIQQMAERLRLAIEDSQPQIASEAQFEEGIL
jgi:hypothetical protein